MSKQVDKKIILGFDLDGVILDFTKLKIKLAQERGFELEPRHTPSEVIKNHLPPEVLAKIKPQFYENPAFADYISLTVDAKDTLGKIRSFGIPFYLVSRRKERGQARKLAIQTMQRLEIWPQYFNPDNTFFVCSAEEKNKIAKKLGLIAYIDDEEKVLNKMGYVRQRVLFDPFGVHKQSNFPKISSLPELAAIFHSSLLSQ